MGEPNENNVLSQSDQLSSKLEVWKVSEFTEKVNELFKIKYNTEINVTLNTLNNYFRQLESSDVHHLNRINSTKVYNALDLEVAEFFIVKRTKALNNGIAWQIPQIIDALSRSNIVRKKEHVDEDVNTEESIEVSSEQLLLLKESFETIINEFNEIKKQTAANKLLIESQESISEKVNEQVSEQVNEKMLDLFTKQRQLRLEAIDLWEQKDPKERFSGLFFKKENIIERDKFIEKYIIDKLSNMINEDN